MESRNALGKSGRFSKHELTSLGRRPRPSFWRLAQALGLVYRSYNAWLINYDDLVGIPLPDETQTSLRYIITPTAIWDAEVVFVDELNRTRPDLQKKLFPIIHDRRVQGVELEKLRYRWAAMNPAANGDRDHEEQYLGAEPLDPALADRSASSSRCLTGAI
jgi:MoxR-like ATPase